MILNTRSSVVRPACRRGTILPILALTIVVIVGFLALAIDVGMLAIAQTQAQGGADLVALVSARTLNGDSSANYNMSAATINGQNVLTSNLILGQQLQTSQLQLSYGSYDYDQTAQKFNANFPATNGVPYTAVKATITAVSLPNAFGKVLGTQFLPNVSATAQAVHRPRDIALVMDLSASMRFGTLLGYDFWSNPRTTNNPDTAVPKFGHYSAATGLIGPTTNRNSSFDSYTISPSNTTTGNSSYTLTYINGFDQNQAYASPLIRAFDSYTSTDQGKTWSAPSVGSLPMLPPSSYATVPGGDVPLFSYGSTTTYAKTVKDVVPPSTPTRNVFWELDGYSSDSNGSFPNADTGLSSYPAGSFNGYTQGPGYYGKTFFIWPPDPRRPLTTASNSAQIVQFLKDFGYTTTDLTLPSLKGTYNVTSTTGSRQWPWPNDGGTLLSAYLTTNVNKPNGSSFKLVNTDPQYKQIMRLYNWDYVIPNLSLNPTPCDWRSRFFGTNDNTVLFNSSGTMNLPGSYTINYKEILQWITQSPNPFPTQLRAGRVKYYGSIPTQITGSWPNYGSKDQRFWVEFIDHVLGFRQTSSGYLDISGMAGYGSDFTWSTVQINTPPSATQYMNYTDSPQRPNLRFWFSPITMVDFLHNYNMETLAPYSSFTYNVMQPGNTYEAPFYSGKEAFLAAINTVQQNHPNVNFSLAFYSQPRDSASSAKMFNNVACPLGTNYAYAKSSLLFPFSTINADGSNNNTEVTPYDADPATGSIPSANFSDIPRPDGTTCFAMGLMLSYNQFAVTPTTDTTLRTFVTSSPITFPAGMAGGLGRKGAQKVIIFETDGLANTSAAANLVNSGSYKYYKIRYDMNRPSSSEYPTVVPLNINDSTVLSQVYSLVQQLASDYGTTRNPFRLYAVGFGPVFQGPDATSALTTLQTMQYYAGTQASISTPLPSNQIITGTDSVMSANMTSAFTSILQNGVQIALIK